MCRCPHVWVASCFRRLSKEGAAHIESVSEDYVTPSKAFLRYSITLSNFLLGYTIQGSIVKRCLGPFVLRKIMVFLSSLSTPNNFGACV